MKLIIRELMYYNWNTVRAIGTVLNESDLSTDSVDIHVRVDPTAQQTLRIQTENNVLQFYTEQYGSKYGTLLSNDIQYLI